MGGLYCQLVCSGATGRGPPLALARDRVVLLLLLGIPCFVFGVILFSLIFFGFQSLWFSTSGSLDSGVTV